MAGRQPERRGVAARIPPACGLTGHQHPSNRVVDLQGAFQLRRHRLIEPDHLQMLEALQVFAHDGDAGQTRVGHRPRRIADVPQEIQRLALRHDALPQLQQRRHPPFVGFELAHLLEQVAGDRHRWFGRIDQKDSGPFGGTS